MTKVSNYTIDLSRKFIEAVNADEQSVRSSLNLNANENRMSETARRFLASPLGEKYYWEGQSAGIIKLGSFLMKGYPHVNDLIEYAKELLKILLHAEDVNFSPLSGIHAMMCTLVAATEPGDLIATVPLSHGGHFLTQEIITSTGRQHCVLPFSHSPLGLDVLCLEEFLCSRRPKVIYLDTSYYIESYNLGELRRLVEPGTLIIYDASHTLGLLVGSQFQEPLLEGADIVTANTHKTFPGPHKGIVAFKTKELAERLKFKVENFCSSIHCNHLLSLAVTICEMYHWGAEYAQQMIKNSRALGEHLANLGYQIRTTSCGQYSDNNQIHMYLPYDTDYVEAFRHFCNSKINLNFKHMERPLIRLGTQEITRRGMREEEMATIADLIHYGLNHASICEDVQILNEKYPSIHFSFDESRYYGAKNDL